MYLLYVLLILMLIGAIGFLAIPYLRGKLNGKGFLIISAMTTIFSFLVYQFSGDKFALKHWFAEGNQHYQLLEKFEALGGVEGAISRIKKILENSPNDAQGWMILGKLYQSKGDTANANVAFKKARQLKLEEA